MRFDFINYLYDIGFALVSTDVIWALLMFGLKWFFGVRANSQIAYYSLKGISLFIFASLIAIITLAYTQNIQNQYIAFGFTLTSYMSLYFFVLSKMHKNKIRAAIQMDQRIVKRLRYDSYYLIAAMAFLASAIAFPELTYTLLARNVLDFLYWIDNYLLIRIVFGIASVYLMLKILVQGIFMSKEIFSNFLAVLGIRAIPKRYVYPEKRDQ